MSHQPSGFSELTIAPAILALLEKLRFTTPTPIQQRAIPSAIAGKDLIGIAQTGTGKTLAFGVPMIQGALSKKKGLVVVPTRELALQVFETFQKLCLPLRLQAAMIIGGESMHRQMSALRRSPDIIIGTPGRINDHLERRTLSVSQVRCLVLDEADRMLDMGFAPQLKKIFNVLPKERQTLLFSATMPQNIVAIAKAYMKSPTQVEIAPQGTTAEKVTQEVYFVSKDDKRRLLEKVLSEYHGSVLVFSRTKYGAKRITSGVRAAGHTVAELHSNKSLSQRRAALDGFRNGAFRVLVATDIAARGIDVKGIELVLNFDLPQNPEDYVHRIGRTGRAGGAGHAISFATPDQRGHIKGIERLIRLAIPLSKLPQLPPARFVPSSPDERGGGRSSSRPHFTRPTGRPHFQRRSGPSSRRFGGQRGGGDHRGGAR